MDASQQAQLLSVRKRSSGEWLMDLVDPGGMTAMRGPRAVKSLARERRTVGPRWRHPRPVPGSAPCRGHEDREGESAEGYQAGGRPAIGAAPAGLRFRKDCPMRCGVGRPSGLTSSSRRRGSRCSSMAASGTGALPSGRYRRPIPPTGSRSSLQIKRDRAADDALRLRVDGRTGVGARGRPLGWTADRGRGQGHRECGAVRACYDTSSPW